MSGATKISILLWAKKGDRTESQAISSGRSASRGWTEAKAKEFITIDPKTGAFTVTPEGVTIWPRKPSIRELNRSFADGLHHGTP